MTFNLPQSHVQFAFFRLIFSPCPGTDNTRRISLPKCVFLMKPSFYGFIIILITTTRDPDGQSREARAGNNPEAPLCKFNVAVVFEPAVSICRRVMNLPSVCSVSSSVRRHLGRLWPRAAGLLFHVLQLFFNSLDCQTAKWFLWLFARQLENLPTFYFYFLKQ